MHTHTQAHRHTYTPHSHSTYLYVCTLIISISMYTYTQHSHSAYLYVCTLIIFVSMYTCIQHAVCCVQSLSHVQLFVAPWTIAHQAPLSMRILQARILEWVAMPSSRGILQTQGSNPGLPHCRRILFFCSGFSHTLKLNSHGFTCIPHPDPRSHLPLHPIPLGLPSAPGPSTCLMHPTWAGDLFHPR